MGRNVDDCQRWLVYRWVIGRDVVVGVKDGGVSGGSCSVMRVANRTEVGKMKGRLGQEGERRKRAMSTVYVLLP